MVYNIYHIYITPLPSLGFQTKYALLIYALIKLVPYYTLTMSDQQPQECILSQMLIIWLKKDKNTIFT